MQADGGGGVNLFSAELLPVIRFAGDAVAIAVHMFAVAGIAAIERSLASGAHFVAAAVSDRLFDSVPRRYFFLCDCGQVIDAENGDQGAKSAIYDFLTRMCLKIGMTTKANWMFMPGQQWFFARKKKMGKVARLRERDGDNCWLCEGKMRFGGLPNIGKAATVEHLQPLSKGGNWEMDNLALCHLGCNRHLKDFDRAHKEKMRSSRRRG